MNTINESAAPVREGDILAGKYKVEKILGMGGMGVVVAAEHIALSQKVALKFVLPGALSDTQSVERFLREARAAVRLKSEHVAKVLDVGTLENGAPYMVMEYLEGADLGSVLSERGPLPIEAACDYVVQACEAVAEAHSLGIIHRDIKPQNLFLTQRVGGGPMIKVLDFGVSKVTGPSSKNLTQTTAVMGSPLYMSPEQMRSSRNVDPRSDVWAMGVVLYEMITGHVPFDAESMPELCLKVVSDPPRPMEDFRPNVPAALNAIVLRCLEKNPDKRYADMSEVATALESFIPPMSRVSVERARMVMSGTKRMTSAPGLPSLAITPMPGTSLPTADARATPTPWSGTQNSVSTSGAPKKGKSPVVLVAVGAIILGLGLGAVAISGALGDKTKASGAGAASASATTTATAIATATATETETPSAAASAAASATPSASTIASAAPPPSASAPTAKPALRPIGPGSATPPKNTGRDDDIPSMR